MNRETLLYIVRKLEEIRDSIRATRIELRSRRGYYGLPRRHRWFGR